MQEIIHSACGYRCDPCGAFHLNIASAEDQRETAAAWKRFYGIDMSAERIICEGCHSEPREDRDLPGKDCPTKRCVAERGLDNCGHCDDYPCDSVEKTMRGVEETLSRFRDLVSVREREKYLEPYDARRAFEKIRDNL